MAEDGADQAEGDHRHHHQRPAVGGEDEGEDQVDQRKREPRAPCHVAQRLRLVLLAALEYPLDPVTRGDRGQRPRGQIRGHGVAVGDRGVHVRGDPDRQSSVLVAQDVEASPRLDVHRAEQRHGASPGQRNGEVAEARDVVPLAVGQNHPHFDLFALVLEDLGEAPVVGGTELRADLGDRQSQGARLRGQPDDELLLAIRHVVLDAAHPRHRRQHRGQLQRRRLQHGGVAAGEAELDIPAGRPGADLGQGQGLEAGRRLDALAPRGDELGVARLASVGRDELYPKTRELVAPSPLQAAGPLFLAKAGDRDVDQLLAEVRLGLLQGPLQMGDVALHPLRRSPGREARAGEQDLPLRGGEEGEGEPVAPDQADGEQQGGHRTAQRGQRPAHRNGHETPEGDVAEPLERCVEPAAERSGPRTGAASERMVQVPRQDQEALDHRGDDHADHHQGDVEQDLADDAADQHQRHERRHRGERRCEDGRKHPPRSVARGDEWIGARFAPGERVLPDHDRVVDDDAEGHDEGEQADHVDAAAEGEEHPERGHERHRDPDRDPEGDPGVEKQVQHGDHEEKPARAVLQQQHDPIADQRPGLIVGDDLHTGRPSAFAFFEPVAEEAGRVETVRRVRAAEQQAHRGPAFERDPDLAVAGATLHRRDVAEGEEAPVVTGAQGKVLEACLVALLIEGAELLGGIVAADAAGRKVHARVRDPVGDVGERHVELAQRGRRDLDGDLLGRQADDVHLGDPDRDQLALDLAHDRAQVLSVVAGHEQAGHRLVVQPALDHRIVRRLGQVADRRDPLLHLVEGDRHVGALFVLQGDPRGSPVGAGGHLANRVEAEQLAFDGLGDGRLHVLRRGAGPIHRDVDVFDVEGREELRVQPGKGPDPREQHDRHQQVAGDRMACELRDEPRRATGRARGDGGRLGHRRLEAGGLAGFTMARRRW